MDYQDEQWKAVPGLEDSYEVSNYGRVRKTKTTGRYPAGMIKKFSVVEGYLLYQLGGRQENRIRILAHRLVMMAFGEPQPPDKPEVNHIDNNRANNHISNLEWVSRSENLIHALQFGNIRLDRGERHVDAKLTEQEVLEIRRRWAEDKPRPTMQQMSEEYGVTNGNINAIIMRHSWRHV